MIPNDALINALRGLGYHFKAQKDRVVLYKKQGSTKRVEVRQITLHDENAARIMLRFAGMPPDDIERFISAYRANQH